MFLFPPRSLHSPSLISNDEAPGVPGADSENPWR
jgi:hypothetical protein